MCSREEPYANELGFLTGDDILNLLKDKESAKSADAKKVKYLLINTLLLQYFIAQNKL